MARTGVLGGMGVVALGLAVVGGYFLLRPRRRPSPAVAGLHEPPDTTEDLARMGPFASRISLDGFADPVADELNARLERARLSRAARQAPTIEPL